jgi:hypothetical protein
MLYDLCYVYYYVVQWRAAIAHGLDNLRRTGYPKLEISHRPLTDRDPVNQSHVA